MHEKENSTFLERTLNFQILFFPIAPKCPSLPVIVFFQANFTFPVKENRSVLLGDQVGQAERFQLTALT